MPDVEVVGLSVTRFESWITHAILIELGILDDDVAPSDVALQDSVLIVVEVAIQDRQVRPVDANAGAVGPVGIVKRGILELEVLNHRIASLRIPDGFVI